MHIKQLIEKLENLLEENTNHEKTIKIDNEDTANMLRELTELTGNESYDRFGYNADETIVKTAKFDNGYEMDIKLVVSDNDNYNWTEAVLFDNNGNQISYTEPSDTFFGELYLEDDNGNTYTVMVLDK
jgi:hypothetical protein